MQINEELAPLKRLATYAGLMIAGVLIWRALGPFLYSRAKAEAFSGLITDVQNREKLEIYIDGDYRLLAITPLHSAPNFNRFVTRGDSITKKQNSDTVVLIKPDKTRFQYILMK